MAKKTKRKDKIKLWITIGIIVIIIIVAIAIFSVQQQKETIKIGAILPLSGDIAIWGSSAKGGIETAIQEINELDGIDGKNITVIYEDDQCDKAKSVTAAQKLISVDEVKAIIGPLCSGASLAAAPVAENSKVILLVFGSTASISNAGDYIFRHTYSDAQQGVFLAENIYSKFNFKNISVIYVNNDYGVGLFNGLKDTFAKLGGFIINEQSYNFDTSDFRTILSKIKDTDSEALIIISYGKEGGLIVKQAKELGLNLQIFATDNFGTAEVLTAGGDATENVIFSYPNPLNESDERIKDFKGKYLEVNGNEPPILFVSAGGFDAANILADAIKYDGYESNKIKDYLYLLKNYSGLSGIISFDENGDATKDFTLQTVKNGTFVSYEGE